MKKKIIWFLILVLLIIILVIASVLINRKSEEYIHESKDESGAENIINKNEEVDMSVLEVNEENFEQEVLKSDIPVLIDFYADWCGPCKMLSPIVAEIAQERSDIKVVKVNVDESPNISIDYQIMSIPTLVVIKDGNEVNRSIGVIDKSQILDLIK